MNSHLAQLICNKLFQTVLLGQSHSNMIQVDLQSKSGILNVLLSHSYYAFVHLNLKETLKTSEARFERGRNALCCIVCPYVFLHKK